MTKKKKFFHERKRANICHTARTKIVAIAQALSYFRKQMNNFNKFICHGNNFKEVDCQ